MLEKMFYPASVAVIGASKEHGKVGRAVLDNLVAGFKGRIYPINPKADEIDGLKCYPSVLDVPGEIDLAVIVIPARIGAGRKGVRGEGHQDLVIISAGFNEIGAEGARLENELQRRETVRHPRRRAQLPGHHQHSSRTERLLRPRHAPRGQWRFISQSGALGTAVLDWPA